jgi:hypothetical protein
MAKSGVGSAVNDVSREMGGALGVAVLGSVLNSVYRTRITQRIPAQLRSDGRLSISAATHDLVNGGRHLPASVVASVTHTLHATFASAVGLALMTGAVMLLLCATAVWRSQPRKDLHNG